MKRSGPARTPIGLRRHNRGAVCGPQRQRLWLAASSFKRPFSGLPLPPPPSSWAQCGMKGRGGRNRARPVITAALSYHGEAAKLVLVLPGGGAGLLPCSAPPLLSWMNVFSRESAPGTEGPAGYRRPAGREPAQGWELADTPPPNLEALWARRQNIAVFPADSWQQPGTASQSNHSRTQTVLQACVEFFFFFFLLLSLARTHRKQRL